MKRYPLALLCLSAAIAAGPAALPSTAAGVPCVTHDDKAGDGKLVVEGEEVDADDSLDIVGLTLDNTATELIARIQVKKYAANPANGIGHGFTFGYTFNEKKFEHSFYKYGQAPLDAAASTGGIAYSSSVNGTARTSTIPVAYAAEAATNTVVLKVKLAHLEPWAFAPAFNASLTGLYAEASSDYLATAETYDTLTAPAEAAYKVRYGCGPDAVDLGTPPKPAVGANPDAAPRAGCFDVTDGKGDGTPVVGGPAAAPNEPTLDVVGVSLNATATELKAHIQVDKLADKPANFVGDRYEFVFGYGNKTYTLAAGRVGAPADQVTAVQTRGQVNGTTNAALKVTGKFDKATNTVVISVSREVLSTVHGDTVPLGAVFTGVVARTWGIQPALQFPADTVTNANDTKVVFGQSKCFVPPASSLARVGDAVAVQYGDVARLAAKLTAEDGSALSGKTVKFTLGGTTTNATTGSDGVAAANLVTTVLAGARTATATFAGDGSAAGSSIAIPVTVAEEVTAIVMTVTKQGNARIVTATLKDDDGRPVVGETVTWIVNGKTAGSGKTNSAGNVVLRTAKPTQTVVAKYAGSAGKYTASQLSKKV